MSLLGRMRCAVDAFRAGAAAESRVPTTVAETAAPARGERSAHPVLPSAAGRARLRAMAEGFKAGQTGRLTADLPSTPVTMDEWIRNQLRTIRARARRTYASNGFMRGFVHSALSNVLGASGVQLQMKLVDRDGNPERFLNTAIERLWRAWCEDPALCDQTGKWSFLEQQHQALESSFVDGEILARKIRGRVAGPHGFRLQLLDPELLPVDYEKELAGDRIIRFGVEFDAWDRPLAWHLVKPSTHRKSWMGGYWSRDFERFGPDEILHAFMARSVGQRRGIPWSATSLFGYHMLGELDDAVLVASRAGATKTGFIKVAPGQQYQGQGLENPDDPNSARIIDLEPMVVEQLLEGQEFQSFDPNFPDAAYGPAAKQHLRRIARGEGVSYSTLAGDLEGVNYSSGRIGMLEERELWKRIQAWFRPAFVGPVFADWLAHALLAGAVEVNGRAVSFARYSELLAAATWQCRGFQWVDPKNETDAALREIAAGLRAPSDSIRARGDDPDSVWEQYAHDLAQMRSLGIAPDFGQTTPAASPDPATNGEVSQ